MALDEQDLSEDLLWGEDAAASGSEAEPSEGSEDPGGSGEPPVHAAAAVGSRGKQKGLDIAGARTHAIHHNDACFWQPRIGHCGMCMGYACSGAENRTAFRALCRRQQCKPSKQHTQKQLGRSRCSRTHAFAPSRCAWRRIAASSSVKPAAAVWKGTAAAALHTPGESGVCQTISRGQAWYRMDEDLPRPTLCNDVSQSCSRRLCCLVVQWRLQCGAFCLACISRIAP